MLMITNCAILGGREIAQFVTALGIIGRYVK